ncbi:2OG-Fe(II) oxygenase family protein [Kitasatospora sp. McL0602]|uniref:2OG-Fe(II) oxygenase family protein n=1 Tax=Kitasatospora sp. McL0602 TaxID=3439530 RepID=UPI003F8ADD7A
MTDTLDTPVGTGRLRLPRAEVRADRLWFADPAEARRALALGAFLVAIPADLDPQPGLDLCRRFYEPRTEPADLYRGHLTEEHADSKLGYSDRPDQVEQLQLESQHWDTYLPAEAVALLRRMEAVTLATLHGVLEIAGVPEADWDTITGGASMGNGWCHSTINHYRSDLRGRAGIVEHTDSGFITLLHADQPGLEMRHEGAWVPIEVQSQDFIVNLGDCLEVLAKHLPQPITAVVHRVPESEQRELDRSSFTVFMGPRYDMGIYQYTPDGELLVSQGFRDFSVEKAEKLGYEFHPRL